MFTSTEKLMPPNSETLPNARMLELLADDRHLQKLEVRGGTWTHQLGSNAHIGLVSMGGSGFTANFDYVHVYSLDD